MCLDRTMVGLQRQPRITNRHTDWWGTGHTIGHLVSDQRALEMKSFLIKISLANAGLYALGILLPVFSGFAFTSAWAAIVISYFLLTVGLCAWLVRASRRSPIQFITAVNGSTAIKMLGSLAAVTTYLVMIGGEYRVHFAMGLFATFVVNTVLLVVEAQKISKNRPD